MDCEAASGFQGPLVEPGPAWLADFGLSGEFWSLGPAEGVLVRALSRFSWTDRPDFLGPRELRIWPQSHPGRREEWLLGRLSAKLALSRTLGWPETLAGPAWHAWARTAEVLPRADSGAPEFAGPLPEERGPGRPAAWPEISLSHPSPQSGLALAAATLLAWRGSPGLDGEWLDRRLSSRVLEYVFTPREMALWPPGDEGRASLAAWCAKEAAAKAGRLGLLNHLPSFILTGLSPDLAAAEILVTLAGRRESIRVRLFEAQKYQWAWVVSPAFV